MCACFAWSRRWSTGNASMIYKICWTLAWTRRKRTISASKRTLCSQLLNDKQTDQIQLSSLTTLQPTGLFYYYILFLTYIVHLVKMFLLFYFNFIVLLYLHVCFSILLCSLTCVLFDNIFFCHYTHWRIYMLWVLVVFFSPYLCLRR